jgi:FKBP-type peptidyl-prolyl cis-trans isomerase SlpA
VPAQLADGIIGPGRRVTLHFSLGLENGAGIDSNFAGAPVSFTMGDGNLLPGFENALCGLAAGARRQFMLPPEQAFGLVNEDNIQRFPRYRFPPDLELDEGLMVDFADAAGNTQAGIVRAFDAKLVEVDFNHPLAGHSIRFTVHVHQVETPQEHTR